MAFFDDSGVFKPEDSGAFACFGMVVVPSPHIRQLGNSWWEMIEEHFQHSQSLQTIGIEVKSSELCNLLNRLQGDNKADLQKNQEIMFSHGLNTTNKVNELIKEIYAFLSKPPITIKYLATIANKHEVWQQFYDSQFNQWRILRQSFLGESNSEVKHLTKKQIKRLSSNLSISLVKSTYEFILQRLDYLSQDNDEYFDFSDAFVIGDESSDSTVMLKAQAEIQAGLGEHFSQLPTIVNRPWFGSSLHDPCLQMADWIAFAVRRWAEESTAYSHRIKQLLPSFRGYPEKILGNGIVLCPNKKYFPTLPLENNIVDIPF